MSRKNKHDSRCLVSNFSQGLHEPLGQGRLNIVVFILVKFLTL